MNLFKKRSFKLIYFWSKIKIRVVLKLFLLKIILSAFIGGSFTNLFYLFIIK